MLTVGGTRINSGTDGVPRNIVVLELVRLWDGVEDARVLVAEIGLFPKFASYFRVEVGDLHVYGCRSGLAVCLPCGRDDGVLPCDCCWSLRQFQSFEGPRGSLLGARRVQPGPDGAETSSRYFIYL